MSESVSCSKVAKTSASGRFDVAQAITGVFLALFVLMHAVLIGSVIISPKIMNAIGWFLEALYLAQIGAPIVLLIIVVHFVLAARKMPFHVGSLPTFVDHAKRMKHCDTWLWLVQVVTAILILVLASVHVYTIIMNLPITAETSAFREQNGWTPFYVVLLVCVGLHLGVGLFRVGVKFGFIKAEKRALWVKRMWILIAAYIAVGILSIIRFHFIAV